MIGNADNNVAALYNIEYDRQQITAKHASSTCRVYEHEMFYTSYGLERFSLQSEVTKPILRVKCNYKQSHLCLQPLLHTMDSSSFTSDPAYMGHKHKTANKMNLKWWDHLAYLNTCSGSGYNKVCYVAEETDDDGDLVTNNTKLIITFPSVTLIQGIWWSTAFQKTNNQGYLRGIKKFQFSFPESMGGSSFTSRPIEDVKKGRDTERKNMMVTFFSQPILTNRLELSELAFTTNRNHQPTYGHVLRFSLELFGCSDYQADISMAKK